MKKEIAQQYAFKVTQANKTQLVVIMYDILQEELKEAREAYEAGNVEGFTKEIKLAQKYIVELMNTTDLEYEIGCELFEWYKYINTRIIQAMIRQKVEPLEGLDDIIGKLRSAFFSISKTDYSNPIMSEREQVYAGLTYSKGNLDETYLDSSTNGRRGFTV